ncbi:molecular chaperone HtpG [Erysipelothrix sp. HDW6A]|uniref:molecular chaperone HtpG n=1 Tax=Erysipelothrix sp. HDW6A TaxID=2714928 RepID=UPI00140D0F67|nr:molecular chaperone HtpG [Erysipelothrix sp. HDW6A]QIK56448.1 molecular chaperone HtpG [Erysipelothrix sp. HDW6A]
MARKKQFKAESQRLLDLMINSIYTNKEIFLRELISNASDATDKLYFKSLQDTSVELNQDDLVITLTINKDERQLIIEDKGIGMNDKELESFLGTIANSDSHAFKKALDEEEDVDIIGQFGVGFYSAFMVSSMVKVISKAYGDDKAYAFESNGLDGYTVSETERDSHGTTIILTIKENTDDDNYDEYLESFTIKSLVRQYSDYIRYPIMMEEDGELKKLNSQVPIWKRSKNDVTEEELNQFYKDKFHDFEDPFKTIQMKVEGNPSFDALLYIPNRVPMNFYSQQFEPGLQLYSRGVFIMDHNKSLIPEHFRFVRGLVDSPDLSLNISREILQHDRQLNAISKRIERKIRSELELMMRNERERYESFWDNFGRPIKYGLYAQFGANKEDLQDLLLFKSTHEDKYTSLKEYIERMKEGQDVIYYASGESIGKIKALPQTEYVVSKGFEVFYLDDEIDEFVIQILQSYDDKMFKSISQGELDIDDEETKEELQKKTEESKDLMNELKDALKDKVDDVRLSTRLLNHPVGLVSEEGLSFEMEKVLNQMEDKPQEFKAKRILEINPEHDLLKALETVYENDKSRIEDLAAILYDQASLIEGLAIEDPVAFSRRLAQLMIDASKKA